MDPLSHFDVVETSTHSKTLTSIVVANLAPLDVILLCVRSYEAYSLRCSLADQARAVVWISHLKESLARLKR